MVSDCSTLYENLMCMKATYLQKKKTLNKTIECSMRIIDSNQSTLKKQLSASAENPFPSFLSFQFQSIQAYINCKS